MTWDPRTRRELAEHTYGILAIATIPVVVGGLVSRHLGAEMWLVGMGLGAYVSLCAVILILGDLAIQRVIDWWERCRLGNSPPAIANDVTADSGGPRVR